MCKFENAMENINFVIGLSETRKEGENLIKKQNKITYYITTEQWAIEA